ncbi:Myb-like DNA-binding domain protein [Podila verticillata]|nr:Myb-like DNA-binding domain protein [Podila verticillata]
MLGSGSILQSVSQQWISRSKSSLISSWPILSTTLARRNYITSTSTLLRNTEQHTSGKEDSRQRNSALVRWSKDEDEQIFQYVREGIRSHEIYALFPRRNQNSVAIRICRIRAAALAEQNKRGDTPLEDQKQEQSEGKTDPTSLSKENQKEGNNVPLVHKRVRAASPVVLLPDPPKLATRRSWTDEDDNILRKLVAKHGGDSTKKKWLKIATAVVDPATGDTIARTATSCKRRWAILDPTRKRNVGAWNANETEKLSKAVRAQVGNQFQAKVALFDSENDGLKALVLDGPELSMLNWLKIEEAVGTRTDVQCRSHFYRYLHTASKGRWDKDEVERLKEAVEEHGEDWHKVAKSLGTRIPPQIQRHYAYSFKKSDDGEKED